MPTLSITPSQFAAPYAHLNNHVTPNVSRRKCMKFATTVGISHLAPAYGRSTTSLALAAYRAMAVRCAIDFSQATIQPHAQFALLESSERSNITFWIGMTFAALAADAILDVPKLIHAQQHHGLTKLNPNSRQLADLVGEDTHNNWHVIEAKGRKAPPPRPTANQRTGWKNQAASVTHVNGIATATNSYSASILQTPLEVELVDPSLPPGVPPQSLSISPDEYGRLYYKPFVDFLFGGFQSLDRNGRTFLLRVIAFDPVNNDYVYIGLEDLFIDIAKRGGSYPQSVSEFDDGSLYVASDGIAIFTSDGPCDLS